MSNSVFHGGRLDLAMRKYGGKREDWIDLSTGINPNGYRVADLEDHLWQRLPDMKALEDLLAAARRFYRVPEHMGIVAGSGTQSLIELLPHVVSSKRVAIVSPTYGEHAHSWRKGGAHIEHISKGDAIPRLCNVVLVVNPNNPDTEIHFRDELVSMASEMRLRNGYLIVDEAFCDPDPDLSIVPVMPDNVIVYRSFGKFFGLAGLRLGFLIASNAVTHPLENLLGPWNVSGPALEIGRQAFLDQKWVDDTRKTLKEKAKAQAEMMAENGLEICGINPLFVFAGHEKSTEIFEKLAHDKILVRPFPEMPSRLRFGLCKNEMELLRLEKALKSANERM